MLPLAWHHLVKQAGCPDLVAFTVYWYCPRGAPLPGGGEQGDRRRRGAGPPVASPPAPARLGLQGIFSFLEGAGECIRELVRPTIVVHASSACLRLPALLPAVR